MKRFRSVISVIVSISFLFIIDPKHAYSSSADTSDPDNEILLSNLVIGIPGENIETVVDAGAISTIFSAIPSGPTASGNQAWHQDSDNVAGQAEEGDKFGYAVAAGDFDGDGLQDLAIGIPYEDINGQADAGGVQILYASSSSGFTGTGDMVLNQDTEGIDGMAEADDRFGSSLAVGDFDNDGYDDLAVGVPGEDFDLFTWDAGMVNVVYGSSGGISSTGNQVWYQGKYGQIQDTADFGDRFGFSLASGDFDGNGADDLAIGAPGEEYALLTAQAGRVNVIYGATGTGLNSVGNQELHLLDYVVGDQYGYSLAGGDFDGDGYDDLAVGVPYRKNVEFGAGMVHIISGTDQGLTWMEHYFGQDGEIANLGTPEENDYFGYSLSAGDFNGDRRDDLAIGVPGEDVVTASGNFVDAGMVDIAYFKANFDLDGFQNWHQSKPNIKGEAETGDQFGFSVATGDLNGDGFDELVVGIPYEDVTIPNEGTKNDAGAVAVLFGSADRITDADQFWSQDGDILGAPEAADHFGWAVGVFSNLVDPPAVPLSKLYLPSILRK